MHDVTSAQTIPQLLDYAAQAYGQHIAIEDGELQLSYEQLQQQCHRVAKSLLASGIAHGDRIAIWAPNIHEWIVAALGAQCIGAVLVTLNTRYKGNEAAYVLRESRCKLLFTIGEFLDTDYPAMLVGKTLPELQEKIILRHSSASTNSWQQFLSRSEAINDEQLAAHIALVCADNISDILFTSGTTGAPKGVMTGHGQNLRTFANWSSVVGLEAGDRYLVISPFFHSFGYKAGILAAVMRGATLLPHQTFDAEHILQRIENDKVSVLPGPPTIFQSLINHPNLSSYDISSLKRTATGAAAIPVEMIHQMKDILGFERVITAYGLTESCGVVTMSRADDSASIVATTSGRAIDNIELRCVDRGNQPVANGEPGEIVIRGYNVMKGYFANETATAEAVDKDGWLHTGDIGVLDDTGNLRITDRLKDMYINGGFNCYPAEIENILINHPGINNCAVIGVDDERMGEVGMAFVVLQAGQSLEADSLISWCRDNMANYKVPRHIAFLDALPLNATGKVAKIELRELAATQA